MKFYQIRIIFGLCFMMIPFLNAQKNPLLDRTFWKEKPDVIAIEKVLQKGYPLSDKGHHNASVLSYAIRGNSSLKVIAFLIEKGNFALNGKGNSRGAIFDAARSCNLELIHFLVKKGGNIHVFKAGTSPFLTAIAAGKETFKIYKYFEKNKVNTLQIDRNGRDALLYSAMYMKDSNDLDFFKKRGHNLYATDTQGNGLFHYAARSGNILFLKQLIEAGYYYQKNPHNNENAFLFVTRRRIGGNPIDLEVLEYLKTLGLDPTIVDKKGYNALHNLMFSVNDPKIWKFFLDNGTSANLESRWGIPLIGASYRRSPEVLKLLIAKTKNINAKNKKGKSALAIAVGRNTFDAAALLIENGADIQTKDNHGNDIGFELISHYRGNIKDLEKKLNILVKNGYNIQSKQKDGSTLLHLAVKTNQIDLVTFILKLKKINVNQKDNQGYTALHKAAMVAKEDAILKVLLKYKAKKSIRTEWGEKAYDLAVENEILQKKTYKLELLKVIEK